MSAVARLLPTIDTPQRGRPAGSKKWFTPGERQVIRERYLSATATELTALLPDRTPCAIHAAAARMGLRKTKGYAPPRQSTHALDEALRALYAQPLGRGQLKAFCAKHGVTRQWARERAIAIGATEFGCKPLPWSAEEDQILLDAHDAGRSVTAILKALRRAGYARTRGAVHDRLNRVHGLSASPSDPDRWTAHELAVLLGISDAVIRRWIDSGRLPAQRDRERDDRTAPWLIHRKDLRKFLIEHPADWDMRKCKYQWWLIEVLAGRVGGAV